MASLKALITLSVVGPLVCPPLSAQVTQRVSLDSSGVPGNNVSYSAHITPNGRYVAFASYASNLVSGDTNGAWDVLVRDRQTGLTEQVSVDPSGSPGNGHSFEGWPSADGRYIAFWSRATNLVLADTNGADDVFVRDRLSGTTELVSISSAGVQGNSWSAGGPITPDGRFVAFYSTANNLDVTSQPSQVYVRDRQNGTTELASRGQGGLLPNNESWGVTISDDGRYVAFVSLASNLVPGDTNGNYDIFVRDRQNGTTERVDVDSNGTEANYSFDDFAASISPDGRYVAFMQGATNLVPGDTNGAPDIFVRDRQNGTTERVSVDAGGAQGNDWSGWPWISMDGRYVAFLSRSSNLVPGDTNGTWDAFIHDRQTGANERANVGYDGMQANGLEGPLYVSASDDGRYIVFDSEATNLIPQSSNGSIQVFVRDRLGGTTFTSVCDPGVGGVITCPCSNPPSGPNRGCDNSLGTGGAVLSAAGGTFLSSDSLILTTNGERPTALSIVSQWAGTSGTGLIFGMGVRCTSGALKRLYTKVAAGGSIMAPDFSMGDAQVSSRSAALGDTIAPGQIRAYLVYYRDPVVLGGCPATSTFNCTQTGQVTWSP